MATGYQSARLFACVFTVAFGVCLCAPAVAEEAADPALSASAIALFEARCYSCHGAEKQKGGLRLDSSEMALRGGDFGPVFKAGSSASSELIRRVSGVDPDDIMPPTGDALTAEQVDLLKAWIDAGANWPSTDSEQAPAGVSTTHWAFIAPRRPDVPAVTRQDWVGNPMDAFVLAPLEAKNLEPSPEADRTTLIRRLYIDLLGLPPTPDEVAQFVSDDAPYAYERLVNRLLASPHFGERWGRHWLDLARYADSDGYEKDLERPYAWRYRNWVIDAINRDLPYDQFIIEQLAGDLLPNPNTDQLVATGFHRNTLFNTEGGIDPEEDRVKRNVDRANTTAAVVMGLTLGCAQCHTHKYDPFTQREYFGFYAFFDAAVEKDVPAALPAEVAAYKSAKTGFDTRKAELDKAIGARRAEIAKELPELEKQTPVPDGEWIVLGVSSFSSAGGAHARTLEDGSLLVEGPNPIKDRYTIVATTNLSQVRSVRLETLTHPDLDKTGPGRAPNGNFVLSEFKLEAAPASDPFSATPVVFERVKADFEQPNMEAAKSIDGDPSTGWAIYDKGAFNANRTAVFVTGQPTPLEKEGVLSFTFENHYGNKHSIGRFRLSVSAHAPEEILDKPLREALAAPPETRTPQQQALALDFIAGQDRSMRTLQAELEGLLRAEPKPPATMAQTLAQNPEPPVTHIHTRGDFLQPGEEVSPHTPAVLPAFESRNGHADRLDLAAWLFDPGNPLTARVQVNRIWQYLFGVGLVRTPEDFGTRGEPPTHPELLDWLATEYIARGWSTKEMIRLVVNSSTYRQSSHVLTELNDPENRLLARQNRFRVSAETIRDFQLGVSGLLNPAIGGPSIRPPLPPDVAELGYANSVKWPETQGEDKYRRGLYIFFQRTVPYPMLMTFDCPDSNVTAIRRERSNTPVQALTLLNNPVFFECAQTLAGELLEEMPEAPDSERIQRAFMIGLSREPRPEEVEALTKFLDNQREIFSANAEAAARLIENRDFGNVSPSQAAAYIALARVVLNLDEFVTRE